MAAGYFQLIVRGGADGQPVATLSGLDLRGIVVPPGRIEAVVFWRPDGTIVSGSPPALAGQWRENPSLARVLEEGIFSEIVQGRSYMEGGPGIMDPDEPLLEIYVPLDPGPDGGPRLIGEIYLDARPLLAAEAQRTKLIWAGIALTGGVILALLLYTLCWARRVVQEQRIELDARLANTERLLAVNRALRNDADTARDDLINGNEALLNALAADLHDGPLQMLTAAALSLDDAACPVGRRGIEALLSQTMRELRELSSGLSLPELVGLSMGETIHLAVRRHAGMTGSQVACHIADGLPELETAFQVCLFRVVQEGLMNAYKHACDRAPQLHVRSRGHSLVVTVASLIQSEASSGPGRRGGLGLPGLRRRLLALGGSMQHRRCASGRVVMLVRLPLR
ncbi:sensor histidine kinase [Falsigemmobacter faecalis]|uniref:histidine kinase n=1 Tax=Falsigemmobacter faecalis TaxID=2488730 RepID=A0A3P3D6H8_9RHOB|nr:hypothetical protein [Falsigemmobacter faecalis]RRH69052.1 hypothetical protein EG244_18885 [Falsigemmobacter faecalis]